MTQEAVVDAVAMVVARSMTAVWQYHISALSGVSATTTTNFLFPLSPGWEPLLIVNTTNFYVQQHIPKSFFLFPLLSWIVINQIKCTRTVFNRNPPVQPLYKL